MLPPKIGRYEVLGQLATGGMAEILLARLSGPSDFVRAVVIKRILRQYASTASYVDMFLDEARIIAKIRHPNVVQVQELGKEEGDVYLVLEYVAGENLSSVLKRSTAAGDRLEGPLVAHVIAEACAGLHAAHELVSDDGRSQNLVHRDVSPQNLFVGYDGHVKLLDFGVARIDDRLAKTEVGDVKGKFEYMSPEQARGERIDRRSDIFAMGIVLYEIATGRRLFKRTSHARTLEAITKEPVIPPSRLVDDIPPALEAVIMRALAKAPADRYATAGEMRKELLGIVRSVASPVEEISARMQRWFPERIAEKDEMLRKVRDGHAVTRVPAGEVDENVRVPGVPDTLVMPVPVEPPAPPAPTRMRAPSDAGALRPAASGGGNKSAAPPASPLKIVGLSLLATVVLGVVVLLLLVVRMPKSPDVALGRAQSEAELAAGGPSPDASAPSTASGAPAPSVADVLVHVESRPIGARVVVAGEERGVTPIDLRLPRGSEPVAIELHRAGSISVTQTITPDVDQRLLLSLQQASAIGGRPRRPPSSRPAGTGSGFRRFD